MNTGKWIVEFLAPTSPESIMSQVTVELSFLTVSEEGLSAIVASAEVRTIIQTLESYLF